jgi:hypothetical protein
MNACSGLAGASGLADPDWHWLASQVWVDFYRAPCSKFVTRITCSLLFLTQYALVLVRDDGTPDLTPLEKCFFAWAVGHALDELQQISKAHQCQRAHFDEEGWNVMDAAMFWLLLPGALALRLHALATCPEQPAGSLDIDAHGFALAGTERCWQLDSARSLLAVTAIPCCLRTLGHARVAKELGSLLYSVREMFAVILPCVVILAIVMFGFCLAFGGLAPAHVVLDGDSEDNSLIHSPFMLPVWNPFDM